MKLRSIVLLTALCLIAAFALCACGGSKPQSTAAPTVTEGSTEPTEKGLFVTEDPDNFFTLPEEFQGMTLPEHEFGDDIEGVFESHPVTEPSETEEPEVTEAPEATDAPTPSSEPWHPDVLPEHVFE